MSFRKLFGSTAKVQRKSDSNEVVGTYQAAIPAHAPWRRDLVESSRQSGHDQSGHDQSGHDQSGHDQSGLDQSGLDQSRLHHSRLANDSEWRELYEGNYLVARRFLLSMGVKRDALDDACQDVFLQAFRYLPKFRGDCSFRTWLYRICASEARRHRQKARLRVSLLNVLNSEAPAAAVSQGELGEQRATRLIRKALEQLSETERLVFVLYELEGLPGKEIAEVAECPEATVWRRLHYARKAFRAFFDKYGDDA